MDLRAQLQSAVGHTYTLERELGGGGMSRVFLATEIALDRPVVLKLLPPELASSVSTDRFRQEVRLAARLQHPHIVPLHSAGEADGLLYYTMPLIEGESLRARLARGGELPVSEAVRILRDVAAALAYAHEHGLVHRDIKPENILLSGGEALVTDFGVAKALAASATAGSSGLTSLGVALGTPAYMAPEQAAADPQTDHRADLYAWGCVAYECLTGQAPFAGRQASALLAAHIAESPDPVERRRPGLPPALAALVNRCLAKRPADRPQRAAEIVAIIEGLGTPSGGTAPTAPISVSPRRRRWVGVAAIALGLLGLAGIGTVIRARGGPTVVPSASIIAVMPLAPSSADTGLARLGRDLVITLSANLDGVGDIRSVDALTVLSQVKASDPIPSSSQAFSLAQRLGAKSVLGGTLVRTGELVRADVALFSGDSTTPLARITTSAGLHDVAAITDSITWAILRQIWRSRGAPTPSLGAVTTRSVPALRAFLEGERAITEGKFTRAAESFGRALEADSSFWLAYRRFAFAKGWRFEPVDSLVIRRFRDHRHTLPERERLLIEAHMADSLSDENERLRAVTEQFPDFWTAQWDYADNLTHDGGLLGQGRREARVALERTIALNPDLTAAWDHLLWMGILDRDTGTTRRALRANARVHIDSLWLDAGSNYFTTLRLAAYEVIAPDSARALTDSLLGAIPVPAGSWGDEVYSNLAGFGFPRAQVAYSRRALRRPLTPAGVAGHETILAYAWAARGAWDSALVAADSADAHQNTPETRRLRYSLAVAAAWLGALDPKEAVRRRSRAAAGSGEYTAETAWLDGILAHAQNDPGGIDRARAAVRVTGADSAADLDRSLAAFATHARGDRARAAMDLATLERERAQLGRNTNRYPLLASIDRLAAGRWLAASGDTTSALSLLRWNETVLAPHFRWMTENLPFTGLALLEQGRLQDAQGDSVEARRAYRRFVEWYDMPSARLRHLVDEAEASLERLGGTSVPREDGS